MFHEHESVPGLGYTNVLSGDARSSRAAQIRGTFLLFMDVLGVHHNDWFAEACEESMRTTRKRAQ